MPRLSQRHTPPERRREIVDLLKARPFEEILAYCEARLELERLAPVAR